MTFRVIDNPNYFPKTGFTNAQFKRLDGLYLSAAAQKVINNRAVDCDFDEGFAAYTYFRTGITTPYLQFFIKKVGPQTMMYEVYKDGKGRIAKSGVFDKEFEKLEDEIQALLSTQ